MYTSKKRKKINLKNIKKFLKDFIWRQYSLISSISYFYSFIFKFKKKKIKMQKLLLTF